MCSQLRIANKTTEEIQRFMSPLADMDSLESPKLCHDAYTHFTVSLVSSDLGYVYKLVYGLLGFDIIRSCCRCNAKNDIKIDGALTLLTPTILAAYVSGPSTCDGTAILSSIVAQTIPKA
jgi:hypothetical protein